MKASELYYWVLCNRRNTINIVINYMVFKCVGVWLSAYMVRLQNLLNWNDVFCFDKKIYFNINGRLVNQVLFL